MSGLFILPELGESKSQVKIRGSGHGMRLRGATQQRNTCRGSSRLHLDHAEVIESDGAVWVQLQLLLVGFHRCVKTAELLVLLSHRLIQVGILRVFAECRLVLLNRLLGLS